MLSTLQEDTLLDPVVQREDNFIPWMNHAIPRIKFIPGLNCITRSGDKFIFGINRTNPGIKLTQRLSRVKSLSRCFFVMKHYRKQFCRYICFSNNIPEQHQHFSFSHESQFLSQGKGNITKWMKHSLWKSTFIKLPYMTLYIGRKFKKDKKLKLNMPHTSINFKQWTAVTSKTKLNWMALRIDLLSMSHLSQKFADFCKWTSCLSTRNFKTQCQR